MTAPPPEETARGELSDAALVLRAAEGDRDAFQVVFERHAVKIYSYLASQVGPAAGEDLLAETISIAWERRATFREESTSALPWLYGIAVKVLQTHRRTEKRWQKGVTQLAAHEHASYEPDIYTSFDPALAKAMAKLPPSERSILLLVSLGELSQAEAARALGISEVAARVRLHRARTSLQQTLSRSGTGVLS